MNMKEYRNKCNTRYEIGKMVTIPLGNHLGGNHYSRHLKTVIRVDKVLGIANNHGTCIKMPFCGRNRDK